MKIGKSLKNQNIFDVFRQDITPLQNYIIKGDKSPEHEIKENYLQKIVIKLKSNNHTLTKKISFIKKEINESNKKEQEVIDNNDGKINHSFSIDKKSSLFLGDLYLKGINCEDEKKNIILTERQKQIFKLKDNNPFLYSFNNLHPFSMFYKTKYEKLVKNFKELKLPAPYFITKEEWCQSFDMSFPSLLKGIEINDKLGAVIVDPVIKKRYSGLLTDIIFQLLRVPFGHHISLNVKIFEPHTVLEKYSSAFSYANTFLIPASEPSLKPYERFKLVISFLIAGIHTACQKLKPFNPFDGETFQGEFSNGAKIYVENVTHKPLVARFYVIYKKKYEISGYWDLSVKAQGLNEMMIYQKGPIYVKFPELNELIACHIPCIKAVNAASEKDRALLFFGNSVFIDVKNKLKAVVQYNFNKEKFHDIRGCTMEYDYPSNYKYSFENEWDYGNKIKFEKGEINRTKSFKGKMDKYKIIEKISGSYLEQLFIGDKVTWDINKQDPEYIMPVQYCIPSDGRYREDLIWLYRSFYCAGNEEEEIYRNISMEWKIMMEEFNRWERKVKANYKEKMKIKYKYN